MYRAHQTGGAFFLTGTQSQPNSRPISQAGTQIINSSNMQQAIPSKVVQKESNILQKIDLSDSQYVQNEISRFQDEQESYDKLNELELKLMDIRSSQRRHQSDIESLKSAGNLAKFIGEAENNKLISSMKFTLTFLNQKFERIVGENQAQNAYLDKQIFLQKQENDSFRNCLNKLKKRIIAMEFELGIEYNEL